MRRPSRCTMPRFLLLLRAHRGSVPVIVSHHPPDHYSCLCSPHGASFHGMEICFGLTCWSRDYVQVNQKGQIISWAVRCSTNGQIIRCLHLSKLSWQQGSAQVFSNTKKSKEFFAWRIVNGNRQYIAGSCRKYLLTIIICRRVVNSADKRAGIISLKTIEFFCIFSGKQVADQRQYAALKFNALR